MSRISDEKLGIWFDPNPIPMWVFDSETLDFLEVNATAVARYGYSREEFLAMKISDIRPSGDIPALLAEVAERYANTGRIWRHRKKDGTEISVQITSVPIGFEGRPAVLVSATDVTELVSAAHELAIQREFLKDVLSTNPGLKLARNSDHRFSLLNGATGNEESRAAVEERERMLTEAERVAEVGSWRYDLVADYAVWSENMYRVLGVEREDTDPLKLRGFVEHFVHPDDRERVLADIRAAVEQAKPYEIEYRVVHPSGEERDIRARGVIVRRDGAGRALEMTGTVQDITERKRAEAALRRTEEQLRQAQRMEAIGRLAGGVAHDFNNILTVINGYGELLSANLPADGPHREGLHEIVRAGHRAAGLTRQLLAFSRRQVLDPQVINVNEVLSGCETLIRRLIGEDIEFVTTFAPDLGFVMADPSQMEQVLMNLAVNARDAMPSGGRLLLETRNVDLDEDYAAAAPGVRPGPHVMIAVSDTGHGMDARTRTRIFEPFFTTKEQGKGTGLGLATVYGIIKQSGGHIWVYSEPGLGATFKIYFPRVAASPKPSRPLPVVVGSLEGNETILVIEDDDILRRFVREVLAGHGYMVLEARSGGEALTVSAAHPGDIHLIITDVVMPGMSGRAAADALQRTRHAAKALYISGYTENAIVHHGHLDPGVDFLAKPFGPDALARRVRAVLDSDPVR